MARTDGNKMMSGEEKSHEMRWGEGYQSITKGNHALTFSISPLSLSLTQVGSQVQRGRIGREIQGFVGTHKTRARRPIFRPTRVATESTGREPLSSIRASCARMDSVEKCTRKIPQNSLSRTCASQSQQATHAQPTHGTKCTQPLFVDIVQNKEERPVHFFGLGVNSYFKPELKTRKACVPACQNPTREDSTTSDALKPKCARTRKGTKQK